MRLTYKGIVFWGEQGGCDDEFAEKILRARMNLSELEADFAATAQAREKAAMTAYNSFTLAPPTRRAAEGSQPVQPKAKERSCLSERCCGKLLDRSEFSKKQ